MLTTEDDLTTCICYTNCVVALHSRGAGLCRLVSGSTNYVIAIIFCPKRCERSTGKPILIMTGLNPPIEIVIAIKSYPIASMIAAIYWKWSSILSKNLGHLLQSVKHLWRN